MKQFMALINSRRTLYVLLGLIGVLLVAIAFNLGSVKQEGKYKVIPGVGVVDEAGMPIGRTYIGKAKYIGGMGGGGMAGARGAIAPQRVSTSSTMGMEIESRNIPSSSWPKSPLVIRNASLRLRVKDVAKAHEEIAAIARQTGGYVADTTYSAEAGPASASITIRVPGTGLDSVINRIASLGKLLEKQISTEEVTEEYIDLTSRLRNLEREETRLLELLQRTGKIKDLLEVEQTLARVRGEAETISGRIRYLENRVALSTVTVNLEGPEPAPTTGGPAWAASDVLRESTRSLLNTARGLATIAIWLGVYSPVWLVVLLIAFWLKRKTKRIQVMN